MEQNSLSSHSKYKVEYPIEDYETRKEATLSFPPVESAPVIEEFKILQESCKQSGKEMHPTSILLARFLHDLNNLARILQDFELK